jgi:hypothetical protein
MNMVGLDIQSLWIFVNGLISKKTGYPTISIFKISKDPIFLDIWVWYDIDMVG